MTARELDEWIGATPDTPTPPRVRLRVFERFHGVCQCGCTRRIFPGDAWQCDHTIAIINGGENRESNLRPLLVDCHASKSSDDVAEKSKVYATRARHLGIKPKRKWRWG